MYELLQGSWSEVAERPLSSFPSVGEASTFIIYLYIPTCFMWCRVCAVCVVMLLHFAKLSARRHASAARGADGWWPVWPRLLTAGAAL